MLIHKLSVLGFLLFMLTSVLGKVPIVFSGSASNDVYLLLKGNGIAVNRFDDPETAIRNAPVASGVLISAPGYPGQGVVITEKMLRFAAEKKLRLYIEYPSSMPGVEISGKPFVGQLERGVITGRELSASLGNLSIVGINDCHVLRANMTGPQMVLARVAGFDKAEFGIDDVEAHGLLYQRSNQIVATTCLSNFITGRYGPKDSWKKIWEYLISWLAKENLSLKELSWHVEPMYGRDDKLPEDAGKTSIAKGASWFYKGRFFVHPDWQDKPYHHMRNYLVPGGESGPPLDAELPMGDGTLGITEGHTSAIYHDGRERYRYWIRYDVQGEVSFALAAAGQLLGNPRYKKMADRLGDYLFHNPFMMSTFRSDTTSDLYGLIGWSSFKPQVDIFYGDDNARAVLGMIGASAYLKTGKWDREIVETILSNFRTTGKLGFRGERLNAMQIDSLGWKHFWNGDVVNPHPHFEAWLWACYLWLYDKTGYKPLLERTKNAIRMTMEAYPDKWKWTNGIQQERARMILPLAWLVRVEDTEEHRNWLNTIVSRLLENQDECGAIMEELGDADKGMFGRTKSNKEYGLYEAPLIFRNGDRVADMLYTSNFAFFALNEAAHATGNPRYQAAVNRLSEFLTRIQVKSEKHIDVDGSWFRGFDYGRWDYWGSNADIGWGVWATLTGWIQSWIVATQVLVEEKQSYWEKTKQVPVNDSMEGVWNIMFRE